MRRPARSDLGGVNLLGVVAAARDRRRAHEEERREQLARQAELLRRHREIAGGQDLPPEQGGFWMVVVSARPGPDGTTVLVSDPTGGGGRVLPGVVVALTLLVDDVDEATFEDYDGPWPRTVWAPALWWGLWQGTRQTTRGSVGARVVPVSVVAFDAASLELTVTGVSATDVRRGSSVSLTLPGVEFPARWRRTDRT